METKRTDADMTVSPKSMYNISSHSPSLLFNADGMATMNN